MVGRLVIGGLLGSALLVTGCATKKFVQEEIGKSQQKVGADVGRVETGLGEEKARVEQLQRGLEETRAATAQAEQKATEAAARATEADTKATEAASRADAAGATAKDALAKTADTEQRLTKLWASRNKRTVTNTQLVHFGFDKWELDDEAQTKLLALVKQLQDQPELTVELEGYTDGTGPSAYNIQLSQRRAEAVRRFLVEKGIDLPRIHNIGLGDVRPVADNKTRQGRDQNRRVSIRVYSPVE